MAKQLEHGVKVFTTWDEDNYMLGEKGAYLAVREDDAHDIYVIEETIFNETNERVEDN